VALSDIDRKYQNFRAPVNQQCPFRIADYNILWIPFKSHCCAAIARYPHKENDAANLMAQYRFSNVLHPIIILEMYNFPELFKSLQDLVGKEKNILSARLTNFVILAESC
jgi:hypothetical protein